MTSCASLLQLTHFKNRNFSFEGKHSLFLLGVALFTVSLPLTSYRKQLQSVCRQFGIFWRTFFGTAAFISLPVSPTNPQQWFWELTLSLNKKVTNFYFLLFCEASYMLQYCKCCFTDCCVHECTTRMRWKKRTCAGRTRWRFAYRWSICWNDCQAAAYDKLTHLISFCVKLLVLY